MNNEVKRMNILVLGVSGAGKSTLIKSVTGEDVETGVGEGNTQNISVYPSNNWPLNLIDTMGFEYNVLNQVKTITQIKTFVKRQLKNKNNEAGIDAIWFCIDGASKRMPSHIIDLINLAVKEWKQVPMFAVITKSYSKVDVDENIKAVEESFKKVKNMNLKKIIPVVAEEYIVDDKTIIPPMGLEELCLSTLDYMDESFVIKENIKVDMVIKQKRFTAQTITLASTAGAVAIGAIPFAKLSDSALLVPLESTMCTAIMKVYEVDSPEIIKTLLAEGVITIVAKQIVSAISVIPGIGEVANAVVAGSIVFAFGEGVTLVAESIYSKKVDVKNVDKVTEIFNDSVKSNPVISATISYFEKNAGKLNGKKAEEIFKEILKSTKKNSKK